MLQHPGRGIDVRRRKIWDMYGPQTLLEVSEPSMKRSTPCPHFVLQFIAIKKYNEAFIKM